MALTQATKDHRVEVAEDKLYKASERANKLKFKPAHSVTHEQTAQAAALVAAAEATLAYIRSAEVAEEAPVTPEQALAKVTKAQAVIDKYGALALQADRP